MDADAGSGPEARIAEPVPPKVKALGVTVDACASPSLVTVTVTVIVSPTISVSGVAEIEELVVSKAGLTVVTSREPIPLVYPVAEAVSSIGADVDADDGAVNVQMKATSLVPTLCETGFVLVTVYPVGGVIEAATVVGVPEGSFI